METNNKMLEENLKTETENKKHNKLTILVTTSLIVSGITLLLALVNIWNLYQRNASQENAFKNLQGQINALRGQSYMTQNTKDNFQSGPVQLSNTEDTSNNENKSNLSNTQNDYELYEKFVKQINPSY